MSAHPGLISWLDGAGLEAAPVEASGDRAFPAIFAASEAQGARAGDVIVADGAPSLVREAGRPRDGR